MENKSRDITTAFKSAKILLTGGTGFIGSKLTQKLSNLGSDVYIISRRELSLTSIPDGAHYIQHDLSNTSASFSLEQSFDYVFNLASVIDQSSSDAAYQKSFDQNFRPLLNLVHLIKTDNLKRFVQIGTNAEYGSAACPQGKASIERPLSAYGSFKLAATNYCLSQTKFPVSIVRPFSVFGCGMSESSFLGQIAIHLKTKMPFKMSAGTQTRDFVHIDDVIQDMLEIACSDSTIGTIENSCTGTERSLNDVIELIQKKFDFFKVDRAIENGRQIDFQRSVGIPWQPRDKSQTDQQLEKFVVIASNSQEGFS